MIHMKKFFSVAAICFVAALTLASCDKKTSEGSQPAGISKSDIDSVSYMIGYSTGMQLVQSNFGPLSTNGIIKGIQDACKGVEVDYVQFQTIVNGFMEKRMDAVAQDNAAKSEKMLSANAKKSGVVTTESGLQYLIVREGNEVKPGALDTVEVNYEGKNLEGKVFDSSYERNATAKFPLNGVIKGWTEGLQLMSVGSKYKLFIPYQLAYGETGAGGSIPPYAALIFTVELLAIQ